MSSAGSGIKSSQAEFQVSLSFMECIVCKKLSSPYKCSTCLARYCSVPCYKSHKEQEAALDKATRSSEEQSDQNPKTAESKSAEGNYMPNSAVSDPQVAKLLQDPGLRQHLKFIATLLEDPKISGEQTAEGREDVALKKLRELRKGGREENELVEEFCLRVGNEPDHDQALR